VRAASESTGERGMVALSLLRRAAGGTGAAVGDSGAAPWAGADVVGCGKIYGPKKTWNGQVKRETNRAAGHGTTGISSRTDASRGACNSCVCHSMAPPCYPADVTPRGSLSCDGRSGGGHSLDGGRQCGAAQAVGVGIRAAGFCNHPQHNPQTHGRSRRVSCSVPPSRAPDQC